MVPVRAARVSAVVAQPCRRRGVGQLSYRTTRGCSTGAQRVWRRETPGGGYTNTTYTHTHTLYARRVVFAPSARTTRQLALGPSLPLCPPAPISPSFALRSATPRRPRRQRRLRYFMRWQWPSRIADWSAFWDGQPSRHSPSYQREGGV